MTCVTWVNSGLMTFFFLVVGLEARREFDIGELRERRRLALPLLAGLGGMVVPVAIYLAFNAGRPPRTAGASAMSTDTALALGAAGVCRAALPGSAAGFPAHRRRRRRPRRARGASRSSTAARLASAAARRGRDLRRRPARPGLRRAARPGLRCCSASRPGSPSRVAVSTRSSSAWRWALLTYAYAPRPRRPGAGDAACSALFREQPTPELARIGAGRADRGAVAERAAADALPPVDQLRDRAAVRPGQRRHRDRRRLPRPAPFASPITLGILVGYVVGKPVGDRRRRPGWSTRLSRRPAAAAGRLGGRRGQRHDRRHRLHRLAADRHPRLRRRRSSTRRSSASSPRRSSPSLLTWCVFRARRLLPPARRIRALLGDRRADRST